MNKKVNSCRPIDNSDCIFVIHGMWIFFYICPSPVISIDATEFFLQVFFQTFWEVYLFTDLLTYFPAYWTDVSFVPKFLCFQVWLLHVCLIMVLKYIYILLRLYPFDARKCLLFAGPLPNFLRSYSSYEFIDLFSCTLNWCQLCAQVLMLPGMTPACMSYYGFEGPHWAVFL
jgi:hypothetical protein